MAYYGYEPDETVVRYVRVGGRGTMDGTSPDNAASSLQAMSYDMDHVSWDAYTSSPRKLVHYILYIGGGRYAGYDPTARYNYHGMVGYLQRANIYGTSDSWAMVSVIGDIYGEYTGDPGSVEVLYIHYTNPATLLEIKNLTFIGNSYGTGTANFPEQLVNNVWYPRDFGLNQKSKMIVDGCVFKDTIIEHPDGLYEMTYEDSGRAIRVYPNGNTDSGRNPLGIELTIKNCLFDRRGVKLDYYGGENLHGLIRIDIARGLTHVNIINNTFYCGTDSDRKYGSIIHLRAVGPLGLPESNPQRSTSCALYNNFFAAGYNKTILYNSSRPSGTYTWVDGFATISGDYNYYDLYYVENIPSEISTSSGWQYYYPYYNGYRYKPPGFVTGHWALWYDGAPGVYYFPSLKEARMSGQEIHSIGTPCLDFEGDSEAEDGPGLEPGSKFRIMDTSPCVDAGLEMGLTEDILRNTRPGGIAPDIGCYERSSYPIVSVSGGSYASITRSRFQYKGGDPSSDTKRAALIGNVSQYFFAMNIANVKHELPVAYDDMNSFWNIIAEFKILS